MDDLHIGALDSTQETDLYTICNKFEKLLPILKNICDIICDGLGTQ